MQGGSTFNRSSPAGGAGRANIEISPGDDHPRSDPSTRREGWPDPHTNHGRQAVGRSHGGQSRCAARIAQHRRPRPRTPPGRAAEWDDNDGHAVRYMSVHSRKQRDSAGPSGTRPPRSRRSERSQNPQATGRFRRWWQVQDSNLGRRSRRFYRPSRRRLPRLVRPAATLACSIGDCPISHVCPTRRSRRSWTVSLGSLWRCTATTCGLADLRGVLTRWP